LIPNFLKGTEPTITSTPYKVPPTSSVEITSLKGNITLIGWDKEELLLETTKQGSIEEQENTSSTVTPAQPSCCSESDEEENLPRTSIETNAIDDSKPYARVDYKLSLPTNMTVVATTNEKGMITATGLTGALTLSSAQEITLTTKHCTSLNAHANNGTISVTLDELLPESSLMIETLYGSIELTLPSNANADISAHTQRGTITTEHVITLTPPSMKLNKQTWQNLMREIKGTVGTGGTPILIDVERGNITLKEKKNL
jgi:hypothetical protein